MSKVPHEFSTFDLFAVCGLALAILVVGFGVLWKILEAPKERSNLWGERLGQYTLQILGLTFILPTILIIAVATGLEAEAVTALLGSIIGYIFGSSRSTDAAPPLVPSKVEPQPNTTPQAPLGPQAPPSPAPQASPAPETPNQAQSPYGQKLNVGPAVGRNAPVHMPPPSAAPTS